MPKRYALGQTRLDHLVHGHRLVQLTAQHPEMPTLGVQLLFELRPSLPVQQRPLGLRQVTEQRDIPHRAQHGGMRPAATA